MESLVTGQRRSSLRSALFIPVGFVLTALATLMWVSLFSSFSNGNGESFIIGLFFGILTGAGIAYHLFKSLAVSHKTRLYWDFCDDMRRLESDISRFTMIKRENVRTFPIFFQELNRVLNEFAEKAFGAEVEIKALAENAHPNFDEIHRQSELRKDYLVRLDILWSIGEKFELVEDRGTYFDRARVRLGM